MKPGEDEPNALEPDSTPLFEASVEQILDELERRFDHAVFAGLADLGDAVGIYRQKWKIGNAHTAAGLGFDVAQYALEDLGSGVEANEDVENQGD